MVVRSRRVVLLLGLAAGADALPDPAAGRAAAEARLLAPAAGPKRHVLPQPSPSPLPLPNLYPSWDTPDPYSKPNGSVPKSQLLPDIDCIRYIAINGSSSQAPFEAQMKALGLWDRITVQTEHLDPEGKTQGAFLSHQRAWAAALGCTRDLQDAADLEFLGEQVVQLLSFYAQKQHKFI